MSLTLKIQLPSQGGASGVTKSLRFGEKMSVHEACKTILEKTENLGSGKDHGLFKPISEELGLKGGKWLKPERTLEYYDLHQNVCSYYWIFSYNDFKRIL